MGSPLESSRAGRGSVSGSCISKAVLRHGLHAPSPLRWVRICGGLMEKLMVFRMDLGSWRMSTKRWPCWRSGLWMISVGVKITVLSMSSSLQSHTCCQHLQTCCSNSSIRLRRIGSICPCRWVFNEGRGEEELMCIMCCSFRLRLN